MEHRSGPEVEKSSNLDTDTEYLLKILKSADDLDYQAEGEYYRGNTDKQDKLKTASGDIKNTVFKMCFENPGLDARVYRILLKERFSEMLRRGVPVDEIEKSGYAPEGVRDQKIAFMEQILRERKTFDPEDELKKALEEAIEEFK